MGVIIHPLSVQNIKQDCMPTISPRMERLFKEFLSRYHEWRSYQKREIAWLTATMLMGLTNLATWASIPSAWAINILLFLLFLGVLHYYLSIKQKVTHLYINVHILYLHFLGKLEVGFCEHPGNCQCAEQFKKYVWEHYRISFYEDKL
ncbi:hypothetical protein [Desulfitobacterium sp.]|uniref:hypothetical protein n=1 Tax=Desulfitobacterium sp. TaxID=49981 RepID=UPI002B1EEB29|nr:hypothetical protein [Desulfitobacterium sp.]MEA4901229.1 hypothetical protein [Desulfitobacterium sp.]